MILWIAVLLVPSGLASMSTASCERPLFPESSILMQSCMPQLSLLIKRINCKHLGIYESTAVRSLNDMMSSCVHGSCSMICALAGRWLELASKRMEEGTLSLATPHEWVAALVSSVGAVGVGEENSIIVEAAHNLYEKRASFGLDISSLASLWDRVFEIGSQESFAAACRGYFHSRRLFDQAGDNRVFAPTGVLKVLISLLL